MKLRTGSEEAISNLVSSDVSYEVARSLFCRVFIVVVFFLFKMPLFLCLQRTLSFNI